MKLIINKKIKIFYSYVLLVLLSLMILLAVILYVRPLRVSSGEIHPQTDELMETDNIRLYDGVSLEISKKINVDKLSAFGLYASRQWEANKNSIVKMQLLDEEGHELYKIDYEYKQIEKFSNVSIFPEIEGLKDETVHLIISTVNIDVEKPFIIYKTNIKNDAEYTLNGVKEKGNIAFLINGSNRTKTFIWYPAMAFTVLLVFCSINDWSLIYDKREK